MEEKVCDGPKLDIPSDDKYRNCNLTIYDFNSDDIGEWKCVVRDWNLKREDYHVFNLALSGPEENGGSSFAAKTDKFFIESYHPKEYVFKEQGEWITLSCQVNDHFDVCEWVHQDTICRMEYKWEWDLVNSRYYDKPTEEKSCPHHRLNLPGDEEFRNCYLIIDKIRIEDNGQWKCIVKDYGLASEDSHVFDLMVVDMKETTEKPPMPYYNPKNILPIQEETQWAKARQDTEERLLDDISDIIDQMPEEQREEETIIDTVHHMEEDLETFWHALRELFS